MLSKTEGPCFQFTATRLSKSPLPKVASKETGAHDISSANEAGTEDKKGGRGIYGNIADGEPVISKTEMRIWF